MVLKTITGNIAHIERLNNSVYGNPRFKLTIENEGTFTTSSDISDAYEIGNPGYRVGDTVTLTLTNADRILRLEGKTAKTKSDEDKKE